MHTVTAYQAASETGQRAMKLGIMLSDYTDPDTAQLIAECHRVGVRIEAVLT